MPGAWPHGDPDAVARAVLAQPAYRVPPSNAVAPHESLWNVFFDWLGKLLSPLQKWFEGAAGGAAPLGLYVGLLLLALVVGVLVVLIWRIVNALLRAAPAQRNTAPFAGGSLPTRNASDWREAAERAARAGDYARAIALLFSAALAALDERALVPFDGARTPGEYRRLVRRTRPSASDAFDSLSGAFVRAAFAEANPAQDDYLRAVQTYDGLVPALAT